MKYFKIKYPYFAVIAAESERKALKTYTEQVSEINSHAIVQRISKDEVISEWEIAGHGLSELVDIIQEEGLILLDGCLG